MLFIPIFGDQLRNALKSVSNGNAQMLPFSKITPDSFSTALEEMLTNKAYFERAKELARTFNDNLVHPMDEAMFWIEYVMRSNGAPHLKSHAVNMSLISYLLLDILIIPFLAIAIVYVLVKLTCRSRKSSKRPSQKETKKKLK